MLIVVLALVIIALALLVASLVIGQSLFAWLSIGVSVLAAIVLIVDVILRKRRRADEPEHDEDEADDETEDDATETREAVPAGEETSAERTSVIPDAKTVTSGELDEDDVDDVEPGEEETDAADLLVVSELSDQVLVVDERPRYHVQNCRWLRSRETMPLPVREARDLGFTPCDICTPDRKLATRSRKTRATRPSS